MKHSAEVIIKAIETMQLNPLAWSHQQKPMLAKALGVKPLMAGRYISRFTTGADRHLELKADHTGYRLLTPEERQYNADQYQQYLAEEIERQSIKQAIAASGNVECFITFKTQTFRKKTRNE
ncbi:hypothetical protein [Photobacterium sp. R1]